MTVDTDDALDDAEVFDGRVTDSEAERTSTANEDDNTKVDQAMGAGHKRGRRSWIRIAAFWLLPGLVFALTLGAGILKWQHATDQQSKAAALESLPAATDGVIAMLSYQAATVQQDLTAAGDRLTGSFRDDYLKLINEVVVPGAIQKNISAVARVPAAAVISAAGQQATVLVLVNQTTTVGTEPPTDTSSSVRITMDKVGDRWLVANFEPI